MRYPKFLKKGGSIGFIAPSFGANTEPYASLFNNAREKFENMGFTTVCGPNVFAGEGIGKSNTPKKCASEINDMYSREDSDILLSVGGGETMCEDLSFVDFDAIRSAEPKWFMGYSDNTNLTFTLATLCDVASIYAPCAGSFGMEEWHPALQDAFDLLCGERTEFFGYGKFELESQRTEENPLVPYNLTEHAERTVYVGNKKTDTVRMSGRLLGGCMDTLSILCGTRFDAVSDFNARYGNDGVIWFLESCDLNPMDVRRVMWQLDAAGWFKNVSGFIIGRPMTYGMEIMGMDHKNAVLGIAEKYDVPILFDADLGHLPPAMPLVCGAKADVVVENDAYKVSLKLK